MINTVKFELIKLIKSPKRFYSLVLSITFLISIVVLSSYNYVNSDFPSYEEFKRNLSFSILHISTSYFFLPVWILIVIGIEFQSGHVSLLTALKGRTYYLICKMFYSFLIVSVFTLASFFAYFLSLIFSPFSWDLTGQDLFLALQFFSVYLTTTFFFLSLVFLTQSPAKGYGYFIGLSILEGFLAPFLSKLLDMRLTFLPIQFLRSLYSIDGKSEMEYYYNPIVENFALILFSTVLSIIVLALVSRHYLKTDLPSLSE